MLGGTLEQPYVFLAAVYAGMICGAVYSILRIIRLSSKKRWVRIGSDILVGAAVFAVLAAALFSATDFYIRAYFFFGAAVGFGIFTLGITPLFGAIGKLFSEKNKSLGKSVDNKQK